MAKANAAKTKRIDDGRPLVIWRRRDEAAADGFRVTTVMCASPECPCEAMFLEIRPVSRKGREKPTLGPVKFEAKYLGDVDRVELSDQPAELVTVEDATWVVDQLRAEHLEWLRERYNRWRAQRSSAPAVLPDDWEAGNLVAYDEVFPLDWDLTVVRDARLYHVVDRYCPNPSCGCSTVAADFFDLTDEGRHVGRAKASLRNGGVDEIEGEPLTKQLWSALLEQRTLQGLRSRHTRILSVADEEPEPEPEPEPQAAAKKVGRNEPCPCGSGKKYKRCCLQEPANP